MADAESRPSGLLIAAIIFWFLAAGAAGTLFVFYQHNAQSQARTEQMEADRRAAKAEFKTVYDAANALRGMLDHDAADDAAAVATVKAKLGDEATIANAIVATDRRITDLRGQVPNLTNDKAQLDVQLQQAQEGKAIAERKFNAQIQDVERRITANRQAVDARTADLNAKLGKRTRRIDELDAQIKDERDRMLGEQIEFQRKLKILIARRNQLKDELRLVVEYRPRPVGKILGANLALNFAFINLGSRDHLQEGMRFSVYPPGTVFQAGVRPKGVIEVKRVEERRSQCQVIRRNLSDPVVAGDVLINVALDPSGRKPTFALVRFLDIDGDNADDRDPVIRMIRNQGGEVLPADPTYISVDTDFIVLGAEWNLAIPEERIRFELDQKLMDKAKRRSVTHIDLDTFLDYVGYPKWK